MKSYLPESDINKKTLVVDDFSKITRLGVNVGVGKNLRANCKKQELGYTIPSKVVRGYYVDEKPFLLCENGALYSFEENHFVNQLECGENVPTLVKIRVYGQDRVLALIATRGVVMGESITSVPMPYGTDACLHDGRVFIANENTLYFGKKFDFNDFSVQVGECDFINIEESDGQILKICEYEQALLIVCEKAFYKLTVSEDYNYQLNRIYLDNVRVVKNSACLVGDSLAFVNGNKLCFYKKGKITVDSTLVDKYQLLVNGLASSAKGKYYLPVISKVDNQNYLYIYDTINDCECLTEGEDIVICGGEYYVDNSSGYIGKISLEEQASEGGKWISKKIDFNLNEKKTLLGLSVWLNCDAHLTVKGDFGKREYTLKEGYCKKNLNLFSHDFTFEITFEKANFMADNLQLEYSL